MFIGKLELLFLLVSFEKGSKLVLAIIGWHRAVFGSLIALSISVVGATADFEQGLEALRQGDTELALEHWQPLAQTGDADAQHALGLMHEYGRGLETNDSQAAYWYKRAAEQGMPDAQYRLGVLHENGWGVSRDVVLAAKWYERAARLGHVFAQHDLAFMYLNGEGLPKDTVQAYKWLKIASAERPDLMNKHLRRVSRMLTTLELRKAEALAQAWLSSKEI